MRSSRKGLIIGLIITFVIILIPSYFSPKYRYDASKKKYEDYNYIIKNCGNDPSSDCLSKLCANRDPYDGFCEEVSRQNDPILQYESSWRNRVSSEKPSIIILLTPDIGNGLMFLFFNLFGIGFLVLIVPPAVGFLIGRIFDKPDDKQNERVHLSDENEIVYFSKEEMKKTYNPFKMWGSWIGVGVVLFLLVMIFLSIITRSMVIGGLIFNFLKIIGWVIIAPILMILKPSGEGGLIIIFLAPMAALIVSFLVGWGVHIFLRKLRE